MRTNSVNREKGAVLVEFGLMLLPTLGLFFLLLNLAWILFAWSCVQEAVREAVRTAVTCTPTTGLNATITQAVETYSFGFVTASNAGSVLNISYLAPTDLSAVSGQVTSGDVVKVAVKQLKVASFPALLFSSSPLKVSWSAPVYVSAASADVMSCSSTLGATP